jgi:hypothetical protein
MSNFDHYGATRDLISLLGQSGNDIEAAALRAAMDEGATSTEIFMALRFHLAEIVKSVPLTGSSRTLAFKLLAELDEALE